VVGGPGAYSAFTDIAGFKVAASRRIVGGERRERQEKEGKGQGGEGG